MDALCFALFGKSFRGINIPQLVNSINEKDCEVEIEFTIGKDEYKIIRGINPKKFEIHKNGEVLDQDAKSKDYQKILEEQILKMTYKSFCQVVILGSSNYIPFMQLPAKDRRLVVENLLDIDVFSVMNTLVRARLQMTKEYIKDIDHKIEIAKSKIDEKQKLINTLEKKSNDSIEGYKEEIEESQKQIKEFQEEIKKKQDTVSHMLSETKDKDDVSKNLLKSESIETEIKTKIKAIDKNVKFYEENDTCPSCKQDIEEHHKECVYKEKDVEKESLEESLDAIVANMQIAEDKLNSINTILDTIQRIEK